MVEPLRPNLADGRPRCQARLKYGSTWVSGRRQCSKAAKNGVFCAAHHREVQP